jgi:hypothetical protein
MIIGIDESGSFSASNNENSWSVIAAYCFTERQKSRAYKALSNMKIRAGLSVTSELKLNDLDEDNYLKFIADLNNLDGVVFAVATDSSLRNREYSIHIQEKLTNIFIRASSKMSKDRDREIYLEWANMIKSLSPQLLFQLVCMRDLVRAIISNFLPYFADIDPKTLRRFKWIIDPKDIKITKYEFLIEKIIPLLVDHDSVNYREHRIRMGRSEKYSYLREFLCNHTENNAKAKTITSDALNLQSLFRDNLRFPDSKDSQAIQIADLISSGLRRLLKAQFNDNEYACKLLGGIILKPAVYPNAILTVVFDKPPINKKLNPITNDIIFKLNRYSKKQIFKIK